MAKNGQHFKKQQERDMMTEALLQLHGEWHARYKEELYHYNKEIDEKKQKVALGGARKVAINKLNKAEYAPQEAYFLALSRAEAEEYLKTLSKKELRKVYSKITPIEIKYFIRNLSTARHNAAWFNRHYADQRSQLAMNPDRITGNGQHYLTQAPQ